MMAHFKFRSDPSLGLPPDTVVRTNSNSNSNSKTFIASYTYNACGKNIKWHSMQQRDQSKNGRHKAGNIFIIISLSTILLKFIANGNN